MMKTKDEKLEIIMKVLTTIVEIGEMKYVMSQYLMKQFDSKEKFDISNDYEMTDLLDRLKWEIPTIKSK